MRHGSGGGKDGGREDEGNKLGEHIGVGCWSYTAVFVAGLNEGGPEGPYIRNDVVSRMVGVCVVRMLLNDLPKSQELATGAFTYMESSLGTPYSLRQ